MSNHTSAKRRSKRVNMAESYKLLGNTLACGGLYVIAFAGRTSLRKVFFNETMLLCCII